MRPTVPDYAGPASSDLGYLGIPRWIWVRAGVVTLLLIGVFWPNLRRLWLKTNPFTGEANWGHAFFVPLIGLYYLYLNRDTLLDDLRPRAEVVANWRARAEGVWLLAQLMLLGTIFAVWGYRPSLFDGNARLILGATVVLFAGVTMVFCIAGPARELMLRLAETSSGWFGFYAMLWGLWFYSWGIWPGQNDFFKDFGMVVTVFGVVLLLCGWQVMKTAWFPIAFLCCAIPWPGLIYSRVAMPLQQLAADVSVFVLNLCGIEASRLGTKIDIGGGKVLNVAEACAGMKSLMTFVSLAAAVAFLTRRPFWQRVFISLSAVPIAIFCNVMRVAVQGLLHNYNPAWSEHVAHMFIGLVMLIGLALPLILLEIWVLDKLFVEEAERPRAKVRKPAATRRVQTARGEARP